MATKCVESHAGDASGRTQLQWSGSRPRLQSMFGSGGGKPRHCSVARSIFSTYEIRESSSRNVNRHIRRECRRQMAVVYREGRRGVDIRRNAETAEICIDATQLPCVTNHVYEENALWKQEEAMHLM